MTLVPTTKSLRVAVIGGGAAGLSAARILSRHGIEPVVLEKDQRVGGVWNYQVNDKTRPMYRGLRTNLPREIMGYREKPWGSSSVGKSYVTHREVLQYLEDYKTQFDLDRYIQYGAQVTQLKVLKDEKSQLKLGNDDEEEADLPLFELEWQQQQPDGSEELSSMSQCRTFDAVCVANGHYAKPAFAHVDGMQEHFRGTILHSIEYDDPSQFTDQTVLCIGGRASGSDLAREISHFANKVYLSDTTCQVRDSWEKVTWVPTTQRVHEDGSIEFACEETERATNVDTIIFCTGYDYSFPFVTDQSDLELSFVPGERRVKPLYKQLWHAQYPNLCLVGLPHSVLPFPLFELQVEAFVYQLLNPTKTNLPPLKERLAAAQEDAEGGGPKPTGQGRVQDTHFLGSYQWEYCRDMAQMANNLTPAIDNYIATNKAIYDHAGMERKSLFPGGPDTYRSMCYSRDNDTRSFVVTATEMESTTAAAAAAAT